LTIAISFLLLARSWMTIGFGRMARIPTLWIAPIILALWVVTVVLLWKGQNLGRVLYVIGTSYNVIGVLMSATFLIAAGSRRSGMAFLSFIDLGLRLYAGFLLFQRDSSAWFKARSS
jgi:hypothetical protein